MLYIQKKKKAHETNNLLAPDCKMYQCQFLTAILIVFFSEQSYHNTSFQYISYGSSLMFISEWVSAKFVYPCFLGFTASSFSLSHFISDVCAFRETRLRVRFRLDLCFLIDFVWFWLFSRIIFCSCVSCITISDTL